MTDNTTVIYPPTGYETFQDRLIVFPAPAEEKTKGGIFIPDTAKEKPKKGTVVLTGPDADSQGFQVGDVVQYGKYAGQEFEIEGTKYDSVRLSEVLVAKKNTEGVVAEVRQKETMHT
jgi:chaperonin GroES